MRKFFFSRRAANQQEILRIQAMERTMYRSVPTKSARGYSDMRTEKLNPFLKADLKESFDFGLAVDGGISEETHLGLNRWPAEGNNLTIADRGFKEVSETYLKSVYALASEIVKAICLGLNLSENAFDDFFYKPLVVNRYLKYPPQISVVRHPNEMGAGSHVDFGAVTLIYQELPGLEILDDFSSDVPQWKNIAPIQDAFVVNVGYIMEKLTNKKVKATRHRVVNRTNTTRYSMALFLDPNPEAKIAPLPQFVSESCPVQFEPCIAGHKGVMFGNARYQE